ncbi:hypothetical protein TNCV_1763231 [Trichonephila clavipes]|nr:hypothetical protein TNCV_1763231 [Trichonephila clavipes]
MAKDVLSFLPYLGWRVWHVSEPSPDMITCNPICLRLAWLIHRSAISLNPCQGLGASIRSPRSTSCFLSRQLWSSPSC